jgi:hypothetical protein
MIMDRHVWEEYRAHANDETAKAKWLKFAKSWQDLADSKRPR